MAVRSGAGTGVVVALVVFLITTVSLLVLTIAFYAGKSKEQQAKATAESQLAVYAKSNERSSEVFKGFEAEARQRNESIAGYLNRRHEELASLVMGSPGATIDTIKTDFARYKLQEGESIKQRLGKFSSDLNACQQQADGMKGQMEQLNQQLAEKDTQVKQAVDAKAQLEQGFETQIAQYRDAAEDYRKRLDETIDELNKAKDNFRSNYEGRIQELTNETDDLQREIARLRGKIDQFEKARADAVFKTQNPAMLVDGRVIDAPGSNEEVFIDRGKRDRMVLGMTFEAYSDQSQIRVNPQTGELPRGKASLQVIKITDTTSTCKVTRSVPGQPIVRGDVIANGVYDPNYKFKFLVHGKFDVDGDGKPTENEAEYLRSLVIQWGGVVVTGEELPGDLDFLVLGAEPPKPPPPAADASAVLIDAWAKQNTAVEQYNELFRQAREAQIPVLNANRFFILIGHTQR